MQSMSRKSDKMSRNGRFMRVNYCFNFLFDANTHKVNKKSNRDNKYVDSIIIYIINYVHNCYKINKYSCTVYTSGLLASKGSSSLPSLFSFGEKSTLI